MTASQTCPFDKLHLLATIWWTCLNLDEVAMLLLIKEALLFCIATLSIHVFHPTSFELLACHLSSAVSKFILVTIYKPSSISVTEVFFKELTSLLEIISIYRSVTIISGDLNIYFDDGVNATARKFLDLLDAFGLVQHIISPTHACGHTIDLIITLPSHAPSKRNC